MPGTKPCVKCGVDCAGRPRVKDPKGRYICRGCYEQLKAEHAPESDPPPGDIYAVEPAPPSGPNPDGMPCPECGDHVAAGTIVCVSCGYSVELGQRIQTEIARSECGRGPTRDDVRDALSAEVARKAYLTPLLALVVASVINLAGIVSVYGQESAAGYALLFGVNVAVGLALFFLCSLMWIGFDAPLPLMTLQIGAAYAVFDVFFLLFAQLPMVGIIGLVLPVVVYTVILAQFLDIEYVDAIIVACLSLFARLLVNYGVSLMMQG